jgi:hypothetical protein
MYLVASKKIRISVVLPPLTPPSPKGEVPIAQCVVVLTFRGARGVREGNAEFS